MDVEFGACRDVAEVHVGGVHRVTFGDEGAHAGIEGHQVGEAVGFPDDVGEDVLDFVSYLDGRGVDLVCLEGDASGHVVTVDGRAGRVDVRDGDGRGEEVAVVAILRDIEDLEGVYELCAGEAHYLECRGGGIVAGGEVEGALEGSGGRRGVGYGHFRAGSGHRVVLGDYGRGYCQVLAAAHGEVNVFDEVGGAYGEFLGHGTVDEGHHRVVIRGSHRHADGGIVAGAFALVGKEGSPVGGAADSVDNHRRSGFD